VIIESLQKEKHDRRTFTCGVESLDRFLQANAHQAASKGLSQTYVAIDDADESVILGYYTLTTCMVEAGELPETFSRKLPNGELPASLVARLAVAERVKGQGVGSLMLMDALTRCARVAEEVGGVAVVVDALDEAAVQFYERFGFSRLEPRGLKMFIPMATIRTMLNIEPIKNNLAG